MRSRAPSSRMGWALAVRLGQTYLTYEVGMGKRKQRNPTLHAGAVECRKGYWEPVPLGTTSLSERTAEQADGDDDVLEEAGGHPPVIKARFDAAELRAWTFYTSHLCVALRPTDFGSMLAGASSRN